MDLRVPSNPTSGGPRGPFPPNHPVILQFYGTQDEAWCKEQGGQALALDLQQLFGNPGVDPTAASTLTVLKHREQTPLYPEERGTKSTMGTGKGGGAGGRSSPAPRAVPVVPGLALSSACCGSLLAACQLLRHEAGGVGTGYARSAWPRASAGECGELGEQGRQAAFGSPRLYPRETPPPPGSAQDPQPGQHGTAVG